MPFQTNFLFHSRAIQTCVERFGLEAQIDMRNFQLTVKGPNRDSEFFPQFLCNKPDYTIRPTSENASGFIGWLPYFNKQWLEAQDKLAFKKFCRQHNLATPAYGTSTLPTMASTDIMTPPFRNCSGTALRKTDPTAAN